jgi:hypothetical protein
VINSSYQDADETELQRMEGNKKDQDQIKLSQTSDANKISILKTDQKKKKK